MPTIAFETAIADFLDLGRRLYAAGPLTGRSVLNELTAWYQDSRVQGAGIDEENDTLLLQWGAMRPLVLSEPTDLRKLSREALDNLQFADQDLQFLDFTRQVFAAGEEDDAAFDDSAVQMSITLAFEPVSGSEPGSEMWINTPEEISSGKDVFSSTPFVQSLLDVPAHTVAITVDRCG